MSGFKGIARDKKKRVDKLDLQIARLILRTQSSLLAEIMRNILPDLDLDGSAIKSTVRNANVSNRIDAVMRNWGKTKGQVLANKIAKSIVDVQGYNAKYFDKTITHVSKTRLNNQLDRTLQSTINRYGIKVTRKGIIAEPDGYIIRSIQSDQITRQIKSEFDRAIISKTPIKDLRGNISTLMGKDASVGIFERVMADALPHPSLIADREINLQVATGLNLDHAFYQGGLIKTTRDFCDERNNKVFSRDEIAKFGTSADEYGGYTNKSQGEFQGKPKTYNPFTDLGGYNCRHALDWISDDLAMIYRPDLFTDVD